MRFSFMKVLFDNNDDGQSHPTKKHEGSNCTDDDGGSIATLKNDNNEDGTLTASTKSTMSNENQRDDEEVDDKIINDILNDTMEENNVDDDEEDDELFFGINDLASLPDGGSSDCRSLSSNTNRRSSGLSWSSSSRTTSTTNIPFVTMGNQGDTMSSNSMIIPSVTTSTATTTPIGLLEETCHKLGQDDVAVVAAASDGQDDDKQVYDDDHDGQGDDSNVMKEEVLVTMFQNADHDDLDAIISKQVEQLSIKERMDGCKEVHGIITTAASSNENYDNVTTSSITSTVGTTTAPSPPTLKTTSANMTRSRGHHASISEGTTPTTTTPAVSRSIGSISQFEQDKIRQLQQALLDDVTTFNHHSSSSHNNNNKNKRCRRHQEAYNLAISLDSGYVHKPKFLLMFLRSEHYNISKSLQRLYKHFEMKLELFGKDLLVKDITIADLNDDDLKCLQCGTYQILPQRDHADRPIMCVLTIDELPLYQSLALHRASWYQSMVLLSHDDTLQTKGVVLLLLNIGKNRVFFDTFGYTLQCKRYLDGIPYKAAAIHCVYDHPLSYNFATFFYFLFRQRAKENVMKFVPHLVSNQTECFYMLQSYGIPTNCIPQDEVGNVLLDDHLLWIQQQQAREEQEAATAATDKDNNIPTMIITGPPRKFDVLLGRGKITSTHTGNLRLFHIVDMNRSKYESLGKFEKTQLSTEIVQLVNQSGGRFLKKKKNNATRMNKYSRSSDQIEQWIEVSQDEAREKISHCFRRLRELDKVKDGDNDKSNGICRKRGLCDRDGTHSR